MSACPSQCISRPTQRTGARVYTKVILVMEKFPTSLSLKLLQHTPAGHLMILSWLQLLAQEPRGTSNSILAFVPPLPSQRQALKWPHIPSHYSNCCSQEKQMASPWTNTPGADLLLSGYFLAEGKKQAMPSCFASSCHSEHLILGSKQQGQKPM